MYKHIILIFILIFVVMSICVLANGEESFEYDGYILKFKDAASKEIALEMLQSESTLCSEDEGKQVEAVIDSKNVYKTDSEQLAIELHEAGLLEYYEPDAIAYLFDYDYNLDKYYLSSQSTWAHACSNAPGAWKYGVYGNDVKVAVLDSGVLLNHEDLASCILPGTSFIDSNKDGNLTPEDCNDTLGHGTGVAGVIAAQANGKGAVGVAHRAKIVPIKITDAGSFSTSLLYKAVNAAIELDVDVINLSLGTTANNSTFRNALNDAISKGIIVVAASGNTSNYSQGSSVYPGYYPNIISVGNLTASDGKFVIYSGSIANKQVTISAPGTSVITPYKTGGYFYYTGTSFASPYVAGIAALAKSIDPNITQSEFMNLLIATAKKDVLNGAEHTNEYGYGIADAGAVVEAMIARTEKGGFISPIDKTAGGGVNVKIHNPGETEMTYSFAAKVENSNRPVSFAFKTITLAPGGVMEIPLGYLNSAYTSKVSCFMFNAYRFAPVYNKISS